MFLGTMEPEVRAIVQEHIRDWKVTDIHVAFSGSFLVERFLSSFDYRLHSSDASIYSSQIGKFLAGEFVDVTIRGESATELEWLAPFMDSDADRVATLMLSSQFLPFIGKSGLYFDRMLDGFRRQFPTLHAATVTKVTASGVKLESFDAMDVQAWLTHVVPVDAAVVSFTPNDLAAYANQWKVLDEHFDWARPEVTKLDAEAVDDVMTLMMDRERWIVSWPRRRDDWASHLVGIVQSTPRSPTKFVYASTARKRIVKPHTVLEPVKVPRMMPGDRIGETVKLAVLTLPQFNFLRAQYLNPKIRTANPEKSFAVLSEGRIVGCIAVLPGKFEPDEIYLMSDFPVSSSDYPRLSKLVVMAAQSKEIQHLMQNAMSRPIRKIGTTAFTERPVSMKYRGLLNLTKRSDSSDPEFNYELQYDGEVGKWTLTEAVAEWRRRGWDDVKGTE